MDSGAQLEVWAVSRIMSCLGPIVPRIATTRDIIYIGPLRLHCDNLHHCLPHTRGGSRILQGRVRIVLILLNSFAEFINRHAL